MDTLTKYFYAAYGKYITRFRAIPSDRDMLRPVERRTLLSVYEIARNKYVKSAKVVGYAIGTYHPHGDQSLYGTLVRYVRNGLVDGQGGFFSYGLTESQPSAMRYTEVRANPDIVRLMELVSFAPREVLEFEEEPVYIPSPIPLGLIGKEINHGLAFHKTTYPSFTIKDLLRRLLFLLGKRKRANIAPNLEGCIVIRTPELEKLFKEGRAEIIFEAKHKYDNDGLHIFGCPVNWKSLKKYAEENKRELLDLSTNTHHVLLKDKREKALEAIRNSVKFVVNVVDDSGVVRTAGIDELILLSYAGYKRALENKLKHDLNLLNQQVDDLTKIEKMKPYVKSCNNLEQLSKKSKLPIDEVKRIASKYSVNKLITVKADIRELQKKQKDLSSKLSSIDNYSSTLVEDLLEAVE